MVVVRIREVRIEDALDGLYATWWRGGDKAGFARGYLCEFLKDAISYVRQEAEAHFDEAVAVSADGRDVVRAGWVVVYRDDSTCFCYSGSAFASRKIKLSENRDRVRYRFNERRKHPSDVVKEDNGLRFREERPFRESSVDQRFADPEGGLPYRGNSDLFFTREAFCPSPLPEGGEVIGLM